MKSLGDFKDLAIPIATGMLDARSSAGEASAGDFRVLLNIGTHEAGGRDRLPGWLAWRTDAPSNEDLHDQLLGAQGTTVDDAFAVTAGQREAITLIAEAQASSGVTYTISGTKSRLYVSTGQGRNWRIIADGLGGEFTTGESPWLNVRMQVAQIGDTLLFTNGIDPVLAWPIGGATISTGPNAARLWAAFEVYDLLGLGITRAGVVAGWNGFAFIADATADGTRFPSRVYWSDAGAPQVWAPGGESLAGYVDLGGGEVVLAIETIGGQLRCYTDKAIYAVTLVGGDAVFQFQEIYRGDLALAFQNSMVNMGDVHLWMVQDSIVALGAYDRVPNRYEWMHLASGFIFRGMDGRLTEDCPVGFTGFNALDRTRCYQIVSGYDSNLGNVWISWPTERTSSETPDDPTDFDGIRRMTLVLNPRYKKATLVDHGFSAFCLTRKHQWTSVRDFMVQYGVCDEDSLLSDEALLGQKEGFPLNTLVPPEVPPTCIWNPTEDPALPMSDDSLSAQVCSIRLAYICKECVAAPAFAMASTTDLCIKGFDIDSRLRETFLPLSSTVWVPSDVHQFPNVVDAQYDEVGYPTLIQGESSQWGVSSEKIVNRMAVNYDAEAQTVPGKLFAQIGVTNSPHCVDWHSASPITLDCLQTDVANTRGVEPAKFHFYRAGAWIGYRLFLATVADEEISYSPKGCGVTLNKVLIRAKPKNETWSNQ